MKLKSVLSALLVTFFLMGSANATQFTIDLTSLGLLNYEGSSSSHLMTTNDSMLLTTVEDEDLGGPFYSNIIQSFGDDGILNDGDTFTESGFLNAVSRDGSKPIALEDADGTIYYMYFEFSGLEGEISNYEANTGGDTTIYNFDAIADDTFDLDFYAGVGSIDIFIDTDFDSSSGATSIATLGVLAGTGSSPELGIDETSGDFELIMEFTGYTAGMWYLDGVLFEDWFAANPTGSSIKMNTQNLDATVKTDLDPFGFNNDSTLDGDDGFTVGVLNQGSVFVEANPIPEPATLALFGIGLLGLAGVSRRRLS